MNIVQKIIIMTGYVYERYGGGHRNINTVTWSQKLTLEPVFGSMTTRLFWRLFFADRVFFSTVEESYVEFAVLALLRAMFGRRTVGLIYRPRSCFYTAQLRFIVRRFYFIGLMHVPGVSVISCVPFSHDPRYATIARAYIHDPQLWDMVDPAPWLTSSSSIGADVLARAAGRKVIVALGSLNEAKGFDFFSDLCCAGLLDRSRYFCVAAGPVAKASADAAKRFVDAGGLLYDDFVSDDVIMSLYGVADLVWACYPAFNDQASGIFGRAAQFGIPAIVREGSFTEECAADLNHPVIAVPFGDRTGTVKQIEARRIQERRLDRSRFRQFEVHTIETLKAAL